MRGSSARTLWNCSPSSSGKAKPRPWLCRESTIIVVGIISLLAVVTLRKDLAGAAGPDRATLDVVGRALVAIKDGTFLLGTAYCAGLGNGLPLGYLMYRSGLVPRRMALLGVIGGPLSVVGATCVLFGAWEQTSATQFIFTIPGRLGGVARHLSDRQGLQALADPRRRSVYRRELGLPAPCGGCALDVPQAAVLCWDEQRQCRERRD
jgi:Domain of unknown function (DUF4386)